MSSDLVPMENGQVAAMVTRAQQEVQAAIISAKKYPRNEGAVLKRIESACANPRLAETAMYAYARGGSQVTGPSIRLLEVIAQYWGNMDFGFKEIGREPGASIVQAYCYDYETNLRRSIEFHVLHVRDTKKGSYALNTERDIYELVANQASRRTRNCLEGVIPRHVVDAAVDACEQTLKNSGSIEDKRKKIVAAFAEFDVSVHDIEKRLGKKLHAISDIDYIQLQKIWRSLKDNMSDKADWFDAAHDPAKIKREMDSAPQALQEKPDPMRQARQALDSAVTRMLSMKGAPATFLGKIDLGKASVSEILEVVDEMNAWIPEGAI